MSVTSRTGEFAPCPRLVRPEYVIRPAVSADVERIVEMGVAFHEDSHYSKLLRCDPTSMEALAKAMLASPGALILVAAHVPPSPEPLDSRIIGMVGLTTYVHPVSGEFLSTELFWWVEPSHRGSVGIRLLRRAERWAADTGALRLQMIAPSAQVEDIYQRLGYTKVEVSYQKSLAKVGV